MFIDYSQGFGGKYGVQSDRVDQSAKGWDEKSQTELHPSQKDFKQGFGGKFGVQTDRVDRSAKGWSETSKTELHPSQTDMKKGFGGKYGVDSENQDKVGHTRVLETAESHCNVWICYDKTFTCEYEIYFVFFYYNCEASTPCFSNDLLVLPCVIVCLLFIIVLINLFYPIYFFL